MNYNKGTGQYDLEYSKCSCFWGTSPGKFVKLIPDFITSGNVLDLGAGEGKNSIYLSELGYMITAVEVSDYAINNFKQRLENLNSPIKNNIEIIHDDVLVFESKQQYDIIIAYGLLHCLPSIDHVDIVIEKMMNWCKKDGIIIAVSFNNSMGVPNVQDYLEPTLLPVNYLKNKFSNFELLKYEDGIITETHPTSNIEHSHSLTRAIFKKIR